MASQLECKLAQICCLVFGAPNFLCKFINKIHAFCLLCRGLWEPFPPIYFFILFRRKVCFIQRTVCNLVRVMVIAQSQKGFWTNFKFQASGLLCKRWQSVGGEASHYGSHFLLLGLFFGQSRNKKKPNSSTFFINSPKLEATNCHRSHFFLSDTLHFLHNNT